MRTIFLRFLYQVNGEASLVQQLNARYLNRYDGVKTQLLQLQYKYETRMRNELVLFSISADAVELPLRIATRWSASKC